MARNHSKITMRVSLTAREIEIIQLLAEGSRNKQIATKLGISVRTVESDRPQVGGVHMTSEDAQVRRLGLQLSHRLQIGQFRRGYERIS